MQNLQGFSGLTQPLSQQGQQLTNISVGSTPATSTARTLTGEAISRHAQATAKKGPNVYWQLAKPTRDLKLSNAVNYVNKNYAGREASQRFVYWPDYRVAGVLQDIVNAFRAAGISNVQVGAISGQPQNVPLTEQNVYNASFDPLNPNQKALIENQSQQGVTGGKTGKKSRYTLEEYLMIGNALKASKKQQTTAVTGTTTGRGGGRGSKSPQANVVKLVGTFEQLMDQVLSGVDVAKIFNVTNFDPAKFSKAKMENPPKTARGTAIRPMINANGRAVSIPIMTQPSGAGNFEAFVTNVVGNSKYKTLVPAILQSFRDMLRQRQTAVGVNQPAFVGQTQPMMQPTMMPNTGFTGLTGLPQTGVTLPQVQVGQPSILSQLGSTGTPRSPGSPASRGATSPGPQLSLPLTGNTGITNLPGFGGIQLPSVGNLPTVGGPTTLPNVGGINLPTVGGTSIQLPTLNLSGTPQ